MSKMKRTGNRSIFDKDPQLYTNIMHQASLGLTGIQIAEKLGITAEATQNTIRVTRAISRKDWDDVIKAVRNEFISTDLLNLAAAFTKTEIPQTVWDAKAAEAAKRKDQRQTRIPKDERTQEEDNQSNRKLTAWETRMLENSNQMLELMIQMMDVVLPKYTVEIIIAIKDGVKEIVEKSDAELETIKEIQKKVDAIDANWYTTKDILGAIKENTGKWRNRT